MKDEGMPDGAGDDLLDLEEKYHDPDVPSMSVIMAEIEFVET